MTEIIPESNFADTAQAYREFKKQFQPLISKGGAPLVLLITIMFFGGSATEAQLEDVTTWTPKTIQKHIKVLETYELAFKTPEYHGFKYVLGEKATQLDLFDQSRKLYEITLNSSIIESIKDFNTLNTTTIKDQSRKVYEIKGVDWPWDPKRNIDESDPLFEIYRAITDLGINPPTNLALSQQPGITLEFVQRWKRAIDAGKGKNFVWQMINKRDAPEVAKTWADYEEE
jgi:hypothetical protein